MRAVTTLVASTLSLALLGACGTAGQGTEPVVVLGTPGGAPAASPAAGPPDPPVSVLTPYEVLSERPTGPVTAYGALFAVDGEAPRLCSSWLESEPPQCGGTFLMLEGLETDALPALERDGGVTWSPHGITLRGSLRGDTFVVIADPVNGRRLGTGAPTPDEVTPDVAEVRCSAEGARVLTPRVAARADGVHLSVTTEGEGIGIGFGVQAYAPGGFHGMGENALPGTREFVVPLPPGTAEVDCYGIDGPHGTRATVEVVDPARFHRPTVLECDGTNTIGTTADYAERPPPAADLGEATRAALRGYTTRLDAVERVGYPEAEPPTMGAYRDGRLQATLRFLPSGDGFFPDALELCESLRD